MRLRQVEALLLVCLMGCASTPRTLFAQEDSYEAQIAAARYELRILTAANSQEREVEVAPEPFQQAMRVLAREVEASTQPMQTARLLMEGGLEADLVAEVKRGRVVRLLPEQDGSPLAADSAQQLKRKYLNLCQQEYGGGDCLGLLADGPLLDRDDLRTLGLALSLKGVLKETRHALKEMVSPQALIAMVVWTCCLYLTLWLLPEPVSKVLAASLTLALLAWLPVHTLWELMDGWGQLVSEVDRATSFEQVAQAGERFSRLLGENTARVLVVVVTAALSGGAGQFTARLSKLPGHGEAAAWAEAQGMSLAQAGAVEAVGVADEGTFTLMVRRPGSQGLAATVEADAEAGVTTIVRHHGGNRQVVLNGQRWHVPADKSIREIPSSDPLGDQLQTAAQRIAQSWSRRQWSEPQRKAIELARAEGKHLEAHLMERRFRGQFVERQLREQFPHLRWSPQGVDAVDPATGRAYEVLTGTKWNMELHGRRMSEELFRLISF